MSRLAIALAVAAAVLLLSPAPQAKANALPYYWLPWTAGESRYVEQGNGGTFSHTGSSYYAWDFDAAINNWLVRASRGGIVVAIQDGFSDSQGGCGSQYNDYTNYVKIDTGDGYETLYAHLQYGSVSGRISLGQSIAKYTSIANTDSTGYVCGANPDHLHYVVQIPCSDSFCTSVSSGFLDSDVLRQNADGIPRTNQNVVSGNHPDAMPGPDACSWSSSNLRLVARGANNGVYQNHWEGSNWSGWQPLQGTATSDPTCNSRAINLVNIYVRGSDGSIWERYWNGSWSNWNSMQAPLGGASGGPDACSWSASNLRVVVTAANGGVYQNHWEGSGWSGWQPLEGNTATSDPTCESRATNLVNIYVRRSSDGYIWERYWNGSWSNWNSMQGPPGGAAGSPDACSWGANDLRVVARGADSRVWQRYWNGSNWSGWEYFSGLFASSEPACVSRATNRVDIWARDTNGVLQRNYWNGSSWTGWEPEPAGSWP